MATWFSRMFRRSARRVEAPKIRARSEELGTTKVDLVEFTPPLLEFLGRSAYVQLSQFEDLAWAVATAPTTAAKTAISRAAELSLGKHHRLVDEIVRAGGEPGVVMEPYTAAVDHFQRITQGADWYENLVTCYLTGGFLDDFFGRLALGLPGEAAARIQTTITGESGQAVLVELLKDEIDGNPRLASRLAMWGRRLAGDTILVARSALVYSENHSSDEARFEPVFTDLIAAHTRRMDALGLTA